MALDEFMRLALEAGCWVMLYHPRRESPRATLSHLLNIIDRQAFSSPNPVSDCPQGLFYANNHCEERPEKPFSNRHNLSMHAFQDDGWMHSLVRQTMVQRNHCLSQTGELDTKTSRRRIGDSSGMKKTGPQPSA